MFPLMEKHVVFDCDGTLIDTSQFKYKAFPEIKELLSELSKNYKLYVWTARDRLSTQRILSDLELIQYFEAICTADDAPPKPNVTGLAQLVGTFSKSSICVIGDTSFDVLGAKNFNVLAIGAAWNSHVRSEVLLEAGADFIATRPFDCSNIIQQNLK